MHCFNLKAEEKFDPKKHVERVLGRVAEGDVTVACWEPGQVSPYHCHPNATEIYFCFEGGGVMKTPTETVEVVPGSFVVHPPGELHEWNTGPQADAAVPGALRQRVLRPHEGMAEQPGLEAAAGGCRVFQGGVRGDAMSDREEEGFGFAPEHDAPIPYMRGYAIIIRRSAMARRIAGRITPRCRSRRSNKPLAESRIGLITTAAPYQPDKGDQGPGAPYNGAAKFYTVYSGETDRDHDLRISHIGYDRAHTTAEDSNTWFPLPALRRLAESGRIGEIAPRFHGAPTDRSHRATLRPGLPGAAEAGARGQG